MTGGRPIVDGSTRVPPCPLEIEAAIRTSKHAQVCKASIRESNPPSSSESWRPLGQPRGGETRSEVAWRGEGVLRKREDSPPAQPEDYGGGRPVPPLQGEGLKIFQTNPTTEQSTPSRGFQHAAPDDVMALHRD